MGRPSSTSGQFGRESAHSAASRWFPAVWAREAVLRSAKASLFFKRPDLLIGKTSLRLVKTRLSAARARLSAARARLSVARARLSVARARLSVVSARLSVVSAVLRLTKTRHSAIKGGLRAAEVCQCPQLRGGMQGERRRGGLDRGEDGDAEQSDRHRSHSRHRLRLPRPGHWRRRTERVERHRPAPRAVTPRRGGVPRFWFRVSGWRQATRRAGGVLGVNEGAGDERRSGVRLSGPLRRELARPFGIRVMGLRVDVCGLRHPPPRLLSLSGAGQLPKV